MNKVTRIVDFDDKDFDPFFSEEAAFGDTVDPYPRIEELMNESSVHPIAYRSIFTDTENVALRGIKQYTILGYDAVKEVLMTPEMYLNKAFKYTLGISFGKSISTMDGEEHQRYRRIFQKTFLPHIVASWGETLVAPVVERLMDNFVDRGHADLVQEFTKHYPFQIIYKQLDLPKEDVQTFHKLAVSQTLYAAYPDAAAEAGRKLGTYFTELVAERSANPGDDLVSILATTEVDGERLPLDVLVSFLRQLVNAAGDTTYRSTSVLLTCLLRNPSQFEAIKNDRSLIPQAIEEGVRWDGPVLVTQRMSAEDTVLDGKKIEKGALLNVVLGSANRDERKFLDPHTFDIFRDPKHRHLGFAFGPHICIGQHLARVEITRALDAIFERLPNLRLDPDMPEPDIRGFLLRVPKHLHVKFG